MTYRRHHSENMERPIATPGPVLFWDEGERGSAVVFSCPCGAREVYVTSPPHTIEFDDDGRLTLDGSVGSKALGPNEHRRVFDEYLSELPANWCHFWVKGGAPELCDDAICPGSTP